jgi:IS5 family transposase
MARQPSLFYAAFGAQAELIKDDLLDPIDALLDDAELVDIVRNAQAGRSPNAKNKGRKVIRSDRLLRCYALKHIKDWSFRDLERELRVSLVYRRFTRFDEAPIPDFSTFSRNFGVLGPDVTHQVHRRVVVKACQEKIAKGRRLRVDTTVVESNIHHPTDSTLLQDGIRVLTRSIKKIREECLAGTVKVVDHACSAQRRVLEIHRAAKRLTDSSRERLKGSYHKLVGLAGQVVRKAEKVSKDLASGAAPIVGSGIRVIVEECKLRQFGPLIKKVIAQTKARVFEGNTHVADKIVSIFEEHTQVIRKGKAHKPVEFGRLVRIDEVENGIVSGYEVQDGNPADAGAWTPALDQHKKTFGRAPYMATGDRGFFSAKNEREAKDLGVKRVILPARGPLSRMRAALQKQRWFRRGLKWRGGIEPRIANLKHRFGMARAHYKGDRGFKRFVGWSVIAQNLVSIARVQSRRKAQQSA